MEFMLAVVEHSGIALQFASERLKLNKVLACKASNSLATLAFADDRALIALKELTSHVEQNISVFVAMLPRCGG